MNSLIMSNSKTKILRNKYSARHHDIFDIENEDVRYLHYDYLANNKLYSIDFHDKFHRQNMNYVYNRIDC